MSCVRLGNVWEATLYVCARDTAENSVSELLGLVGSHGRDSISSRGRERERERVEARLSRFELSGGGRGRLHTAI